MGNSVSDFKAGSTNIYRDRSSIGLLTGIGSPFNNVSPPSSTLYGAGSLTRCVDVSHPLWYRATRLRNSGKFRKMRRLDMGSPFAKEASEITMPSHGYVSKKFPFGVTKGYKGVLFPSNAYKLAMLQAASGRLPALSLSLGTDMASLMAYGSKAISKSLPDVPDFSLFRFVGELREGLPKVPLKVLAKEKKLRNVGGEYLNVQFGIMPLISDLQNFLEALQHPRLRSALDHKINEEMRVRKVLDKGSSTTSRAMTASEYTFDATGQTAVSGTITTNSSYRVWSSCSFGYYQFHDLRRLLDEMDVMLGGVGTIPTAIDLWNLLPWSWLVDWFVNFNNVATNISYLGRDGLYLQRGYVMAHYTNEEIHSQHGNLYDMSYDTTGVLRQERKYRVRASPFGFGYTWKDFNPFQLSILGALGVNRLHF
jgi:hypothetical protein